MEPSANRATEKTSDIRHIAPQSPRMNPRARPHTAISHDSQFAVIFPLEWARIKDAIDVGFSSILLSASLVKNQLSSAVLTEFHIADNTAIDQYGECVYRDADGNVEDTRIRCCTIYDENVSFSLSFLNPQEGEVTR